MRTIYDECLIVIENKMTDSLLWYFQENKENIDEWRDKFNDAFKDYIYKMVEELKENEED